MFSILDLFTTACELFVKLFSLGHVSLESPKSGGGNSGLDASLGGLLLPFILLWFMVVLTSLLVTSVCDCCEGACFEGTGSGTSSRGSSSLSKIMISSSTGIEVELLDSGFALELG